MPFRPLATPPHLPLLFLTVGSRSCVKIHGMQRLSSLDVFMCVVVKATSSQETKSDNWCSLLGVTFRRRRSTGPPADSRLHRLRVNTQGHAHFSLFLSPLLPVANRKRKWRGMAVRYKDTDIRGEFGRSPPGRRRRRTNVVSATCTPGLHSGYTTVPVCSDDVTGSSPTAAAYMLPVGRQSGLCGGQSSCGRGLLDVGKT